VKKVQLVT